MWWCKGLLLGLLVVSLTEARDYFPLNKEVVYNYKALIKTGTQNPHHYSSQFFLKGKLHVAHKNPLELIFKFTDLEYSIYNGQINHYNEEKGGDQRLNKFSDPSLTKPFKVVYEQNGIIKGIAFHEEDLEVHSHNVKKAIASVFQINFDEVKKVKSNEVFATHEKTQYGHGDVKYNVVKNGDEIKIEKIHTMNNTWHLYENHFVDNEWGKCDQKYEEPITHDYQREYVIKPFGSEGAVFNKIYSYGGVYYHPYKGRSDSQYIHSHQKIVVEKVVPISENIEISNKLYTENIKHQVNTENLESEMLPEIYIVKIPDAVNKILKKLDEAVEYLSKDQIKMEVPDFVKGQSINTVVFYMQSLKTNELESIFQTLKQKRNQKEEAYQLFIEVLPIVGTRGSFMLIKQLITNKDLPEKVIVRLMQKLPMYVRYPTRQLISDVHEMYASQQKLNNEIAYTGILTFASLVGKSYRYELKKAYLHMADKQEVINHYVKYVKEYAEIFHKVNDFKTQKVILEAMFNMKHPQVFNELLPVVLNHEKVYSHHVRRVALLSAGMLQINEEDRMYQLCWPILSNKHEHPELRATALYLLTIGPVNSSRWLNIYWLMYKEENQELYRYFYSRVKSLANDKRPCRVNQKIKALQILNYLQLPNEHALSYVGSANYRDEKWNFGAGVDYNVFRTNESVLYGFDVETDMSNIMLFNTMVSIKLHGYDAHDYTDIIGRIAFNNPQMLKKTLSSILKNPNVHLEITMLQKGEIISSSFYDSASLKNLDQIIFNLMSDLNGDSVQVEYEVSSKILLPTDIGFTAIYEMLMPYVDQKHISMKTEISGNNINLNLDNRVKYWRHSRQGLVFYNPYYNVYQGIYKFISYDSVMSFFNDFNFNTQQYNGKMVFKYPEDHEKVLNGLRVHSMSVVFMTKIGEEIGFKAANEYSHNFYGVYDHANSKHTYVLKDKENLNWGKHNFVAIFDTESHISNGTFANEMKLITNPFYKNHNNPVVYLCGVLMNWQLYLETFPQVGTHGVIMKQTPSEHKVTSLELAYRMFSELKSRSHVYAPEGVFGSRVTYSVKSGEKSLKTWDINLALNMNAGHSVNHLKVDITRMIPNQKNYKICVDGTKKWTADGVTGHLSVAMGQTATDKCSKDDTLIDVNMVGKKSHEQVEGNYVYGSCRKFQFYEYPLPQHSVKCLYDQTSVRKYTYDIKEQNVPSYYREKFMRYFYKWVGTIEQLYTENENHKVEVPENHVKVEVFYPVEGNELDVKIITKNKIREITAIPTNEWWGPIPDSLFYDSWYFYVIPFTDDCVITPHKIYFNHHIKQHDIGSTKWEPVMVNSLTDAKVGVWVKKDENNKLVVQVKENENTFEVYPDNQSYKVHLNGQHLQKSEHFENWAVLYHVKDDLPSVVVSLPHHGLYVEYSRLGIHLVVPPGFQKWTGECYV